LLQIHFFGIEVLSLWAMVHVYHFLACKDARLTGFYQILQEAWGQNHDDGDAPDGASEVDRAAVDESLSLDTSGFAPGEDDGYPALSDYAPSEVDPNNLGDEEMPPVPPVACSSQSTALVSTDEKIGDQTGALTEPDAKKEDLEQGEKGNLEKGYLELLQEDLEILEKGDLETGGLEKEDVEKPQVKANVKKQEFSTPEERETYRQHLMSRVRVVTWDAQSYAIY